MVAKPETFRTLTRACFRSYGETRYGCRKASLVGALNCLPEKVKSMGNKKITDKQLIKIVFLIIIIIVLMWFWKGSGPFFENILAPQKQQASTSVTTTPKDESTMAYVQSQEFVSQYLKSPGSAKFPFIYEQASRSKTNNNLY